MSVTPGFQASPAAIDTIVALLAGNPPDYLQQFTDSDWENLVVVSIALGTAPLLHQKIEDLNLDVPPLSLAKLSVTRQAHDKRNKAIAIQLAEILIACHQQDIPVLVLKGAMLAPLAYPDPSLRPMNDIDLLFRPEHLPQVAAILAGLGYVGKHKSPDQGPGITKHLSTYRRADGEGATPNPYLSAGGDRTVEPHGSLEESWFGLKVDPTPGVWDRAVEIQLAGQPAYRLATVDLLIHLTVHAVFHVIMGSAVFVQLYDIGQVMVRWPDELHWNRLIELAGQAQAQPFVYAGLVWARSLYSSPVPNTVLGELRQDVPPNLVSYIHQLSAEELFTRTQQPPLTTLGQRLRRGLADRNEAARWASSFSERWRIWCTALAFHKTDTASLLVGKKLKANV
jgi:hypothetical protein